MKVTDRESDSTPAETGHSREEPLILEEWMKAGQRGLETVMHDST